LANPVLPRRSTYCDWNDHDFNVLADGAMIGRIFKANAAAVGASWMWTLVFGHHEDRTPTHGYAATREAAMQLSQSGAGANAALAFGGKRTCPE
jgi:hypothetical protein